MSNEVQQAEEKKAYDVKELVKEVKSQGLEITEEGAKVLIKSTFKWLKESAAISKTPYDDMASVVYPVVEKQILDLAEKINPAD